MIVVFSFVMMIFAVSARTHVSPSLKWRGGQIKELNAGFDSFDYDHFESNVSTMGLLDLSAGNITCPRMITYRNCLSQMISVVGSSAG